MTNEDILIHAKHDVDGLLFKKDDDHWLPRTVGWDNLVKKGLIE